MILLIVVSLTLRTAWLVGERYWLRTQGGREVAAAFARTEETDPGWQWETLAADRIIPSSGQNGAELIPLVRAKMSEDWKRITDREKWEPELKPEFVNCQYPATSLAKARSELLPAREAIVLSRTFKDYPIGNRLITLTQNVSETSLQETQDTRTVSWLLQWDTRFALSDGESKRAFENLIALLNVSRSLGDEPFLISQLVRIATRSVATRSLEEVFAQVQLSDAQLVELQAAWSRDTEEPLLLNGLRGARAAYDVFLRNIADGTYVPGGPHHPLSMEAFGWWLYRGRLPRERAAYHMWLTACVDASRLPIHEQPAAMQNLPPLPLKEMKIASLFIPATNKVAASYWPSVAETRCAVAAIACERYRLRTGQWPEQLGDLPKDLLAAVPLDPNDGQPLRYRRLADGVMVYAVGRNGLDDGGKVIRDQFLTSPDVGVQLWNVSERGSKAQPLSPSNDSP